MSSAIPTLHAGGELSPVVEDFFRQYFRLIYETALHVTGNADDADDAVQNTFLELIRHNRPLHLIDNPPGYFYRAAKHQALKLVRRRKDPDLNVDADRIDIPAPEENDSSPPNIEKQLLAFIQKLRPAAALIMNLRYLEGRSNVEIAELLGKSEPVVAVTLMRLRRRLKKIAKGEL